MLHPQLWLVQVQLAAKASKTRLRAVQQLRQHGGAAALRLLVKSLADPDAHVRAEVASALGALKDAEAVEPLIRALHDASDEVQEAAVHALKRIGDTSAISGLVEVLRRGSPAVQWRAAQALQALGWQPETPADDLQLCVASGDLRRAAQYGPQAVAPLARVLKDGTYAQRVQAANALGEMASLAVLKPLLTALKDADPVVRTAAADALARQQCPEAVGGLIAALKDRERNVRTAAATALGRLGDEHAVDPLMVVLHDKEWQVRAAALEALGRLGHTRALDAVSATLADADPEVRQHAAAAVAALGNVSSIEKLITNLVDVHPGVRQATAAALAKISPNWDRAECVQRVLDKLQAATRHDDSGVQYAATLLLKRITGLSMDELAKASERAYTDHRQTLTAKIFTSLLRDRDGTVRLAAAEAVGRLCLLACADALRLALYDEDSSVQAAVRETLALLATADAARAH